MIKTGNILPLRLLELPWASFVKSVASLRENINATLFSVPSLRHHGCAVYTVQRSIARIYSYVSIPDISVGSVMTHCWSVSQK